MPRVDIDFVGEAVGGKHAADEMEKKLASLGTAANEAADQLAGVTFREQQARQARTIGDQIEATLKELALEARRTTEAVHDIGFRIGQVVAMQAESKAMAEGVENIGDAASRSSRKLSALAAWRSLTIGETLGAVVPGGTKARGPVLATALGGLAAIAAPITPALIGLLGAIPALAAAGAGALAVLILGFQGLGKAIGGDKKAFDALTPGAQKFVQTIRSLIPFVEHLKVIVGNQLYPALTKAFHEALSPTTVALLERGLSRMAGALGAVAQQWGRFLGSADFAKTMGPLLQAGAGWMTTLTSATIHFADALLHLGQAAIPFTDWMTKSIDDGARLLDTWVKGAQASGQLAQGMDAAKEAIRLLGALIVALSKALFELGMALAPVGRLLLGSITNGLNSLAGWLKRNRDALVEITTGALRALLAMLRLLGPILNGLFQALDKVVGATIGWKNAFQLLFALLIVKQIQDITRAIWGLTAAEAAAMGTAGASGAGLKGLIANLGILKSFGTVAVGILIVETIVKKITGSGFQDSAAKDKPVGGKNPYPQGTNTAKAFAAGEAGKPFPPELGAGSAKEHHAYEQGLQAGKPGYTGGKIVGTPGAGTHSYHEGSGPGGFLWQDDQAVDITMGPNQAVYAVEDGHIGNDLRYGGPKGRYSGWGFMLIADSGNEYYYKHLKKVRIKNGQRVRRGQIVGYGTTTGHIHFAKKGAGTVAAVLAAGSPLTATGPQGAGGSPPSSSTDPFGTPPPFDKNLGKDTPGAGTTLQLSASLDEEQKQNAMLIYDLATARGLTPEQALQLVAVAYAESKLRTNAINKKSGAFGLFQLLSPGYVKRYNALRKKGYDPATANFLAIFPDYLAYFKAHPNAPVGAAGAAVEKSGMGAGFYSQGIGSLFTLGGKGGASAASGQASVASLHSAIYAIKQELLALASLENLVSKLGKHTVLDLGGSVTTVGGEIPGWAAALRKRIAAWQKQLQADLEFLQKHKHLSAKIVAAIRERDREIANEIKKGAAKIKAEIEKRKRAFLDEWQKVTDWLLTQFDRQTEAMLSAFDKETAKHKTPTEILIERMTSQHEERALQDAVDEARKNLKDALEGHTPQDDSVMLAAVRAIVGQWSTAKMLDQVQSRVLGILPDPGALGDKFMQRIKEALQSGGGVNPNAVKEARKALEEALYNQKLYYLQKTADAERSAYDEQREAEREALVQSREDLRAALEAKLEMIGKFYAEMGAMAADAYAILDAFWFGLTGQHLPPLPQVPLPPLPGHGESDTSPSGPGIHPHAKGGIVLRPQVGLIGEAGPEAIIPLRDMRARRLLGGDGGSAGDVHVGIHFAEGMEYLKDLISVEVTNPKNVNALHDKMGTSADVRRREGRF